eukprot:CAMPEP_0175961610 /NCGR_PEP_ID=MMETSP0108-20121206/36025_1 /TAXON_ID=195067 ORGANISM="Goniomonas pacifica, Strain CCMP1869" /NCGR_SAMPLE_ID=MMETSP0108 /ASSEMBLY_ACC=CAM_ASM_000204 /LENGTH=41 /DNA_ID= /DNA_START= /DNA_END= /DNA_ORIENTATION=
MTVELCIKGLVNFSKSTTSEYSYESVAAVACRWSKTSPGST